MQESQLHQLARQLHQKTSSKIVLVVADGLGGLPDSDHDRTELASARTPNLDQLARDGTTGLLHPVAPGITPGSGPGHLGLFGYDPIEHQIGRGVLSALGVDFQLERGDVAARGNFCTVDAERVVTDRRAGRIADDKGKQLVEKLRQIQLDDVEVFVEHVKQYRFTVILRGSDLGGDLSDSDPHETGTKPRQPQARDDASKRTAELASRFIEQAQALLQSEGTGEHGGPNMILLRGFDNRPEIPTMPELYGIDPCAIARYPMYRGLSRLLGMHVPEVVEDLSGQAKQLASRWDQHDFFFFHHKDTDSNGEDGDFDRKVAAIEELDVILPELLEHQPDVLAVTGDHSTPSHLKSHSWHPVPVLISSPTCLPDTTESFSETAAMSGGLGQFRANSLMLQLLAHAQKLEKFGA